MQQDDFPVAAIYDDSEDAKHERQRDMIVILEEKMFKISSRYLCVRLSIFYRIL